MAKTIVVVGAGNGLGNHLAMRFGRRGFRVVLMSRAEKNLAKYREEFSAAGIEVHTAAADAADPDSLTAAFDRVKSEFGVPDVLFYNAAMLIGGTPDGLDWNELELHYRVDVAGAFHCVRQVLCEEFCRKGGAVLLTGGGLALSPSPDWTCLSMDKAALRSLALILHEHLKERGVYVGTLTVTGAIEPGTKWDPELLAEKFEELYDSRSGCELIY